MMITYRFTVPGWLRNIGRDLAKMGLLEPKESWLATMGRWDPEIDRAERGPEVIISSGGKSVLLGRALSLRFGVPFIYVGERKPFPSAWFHTYFTPASRELEANGELLEQIPTALSPMVARAAAEREGWTANNLWAMVIGGPSRSHRYREHDWDALARGMNGLHASHGIRWLVTTSRRTPLSVERRLRKNLDPEAKRYAIWWNQKPEKKMAAMLGAAEKVYVTQDSMTMVTEAIGSGRPTIALSPRSVRFPEDSFLPGYLDRLQERGFLGRASIDDLETWIHQAPSSPPQASPTVAMATRLIERLGWT